LANFVLISGKPMGIFFKPRKYDSRSGYLSGRKEAMMERVKRICDENEIAIGSNVDITPALTRNRKHISSKIKNSYIFALFVLLVLICILIYFL
jgi:hypothetical protein